MEIRIQVDDKYIDELKRRIGAEKATDVAREAFTILDWATAESKQGRLILSTDKNGSAVRHLVTGSLTQAAVQK
ncbi:MAG TPA: hypothetical protein VIO38_05275 [Rariglobus sp.]